VTEIETWLADPYAIYARHVLRLKPLDPLEQQTDAAQYGALVHKALQLFLAETGSRWPPNAAERLRAAMDRALREAGVRPALFEWWAPRLARIADWVCAEEIRRRVADSPAAIFPEIAGVWDLDVPGGFRLTGRADRIEVWPSGSLSILDYKTGVLPSAEKVTAGHAPQLPLEAAMAGAGAFGAAARGSVTDLIYWRLTGGRLAGEARAIGRGDAAVVADLAHGARRGLIDLIARFDDPAQPYLAQPHPGRLPRFPEYAQLARAAEWGRGGDEDA
jgi:ATP-dependent helicase/nuclease subunit B